MSDIRVGRIEALDDKPPSRIETVRLVAAQAADHDAKLVADLRAEIAKYKRLHTRVARSFNDDICVAWAECETHSPQDRSRMERAFRKFLVALNVNAELDAP